jgi:hypothetical protein
MTASSSSNPNRLRRQISQAVNMPTTMNSGLADQPHSYGSILLTPSANG